VTPRPPAAEWRATSSNGPSGDAYVTKLNANGSALEYSTYIGGAAGDSGLAIAIDGTGSAYITGSTGSTDFPTTAGAFDTTYNDSGSGAGDAFVSKLSADGSALATRVTYALGTASRSGSGEGTTAASATASCSMSTLSSSNGEIR